jgi:hypothetical protein
MTRKIQPSDVMPINFSLTDRAASEINNLTRSLLGTEGKTMVATLLWSEAYEEVERKLVSRGFVVAWYELSKVPKDATQAVNGVDLLFLVTDRQARNFDGKTIDFIDERFRFVETSAI